MLGDVKIEKMRNNILQVRILVSGELCTGGKHEKLVAHNRWSFGRREIDEDRVELFRVNIFRAFFLDFMGWFLGFSRKQIYWDNKEISFYYYEKT